MWRGGGQQWVETYSGNSEFGVPLIYPSLSDVVPFSKK